MSRYALISLFLLLSLLIATACDAAPSASAVPLAGGALKLDGILDEPAWAAAPWQSSFLSASAAAENAGAPRPVPVQTRFKAVYDDSALYVGVECDEPSLDKLVANVTTHDGNVYSDDCVELFFDPAGDGRYYHHFIVNSRGAWYDDYGADFGLVHNKLWECPLEVGTKLDPAASVWRAEINIPFAALILKSDAGPNWLFNITRERYAGGTQELSTWSPLKGNFHSPKLFGSLTGINADFRRFAFDIAEPQVAVSGGGGSTSVLNLKSAVKNATPALGKLIASAQLFGRPDTAVKTDPIEVAPGASADITFPPLTIARDLRAAQIQITLADAATGAPVKTVVKELSAEYKPLTCDIRQPVYRQNIYATQTVPNIVFRIGVAPDIAARAQRISFRLLDASGKPVREGGATVAALSADQKLEAARLPVGAYTLALSAVSKDGVSLADYQTTLRKLPPPPGNEVRIDESRNVLVNGKPRVFIGWYGGVPTQDPRKEVIALQNLQTPAVLVGLDLKGSREAWEKYGIYSIVSVEPGRLFDTFELWRKPGNTVRDEHSKLPSPSDEARGYVKQIIDKVQAEPWLLGYYLADEPEINNTRSDYLENYYKMMQELDPYHPVMITNDTMDGIVTHGYKACDILSPDPYSPAWDYVPNFLKKVLEVGSRGKATMMTPWLSSGQAHFTDDYGTAPPYSYRVMRNQHLVAVALGCRGFTGYTASFFMPEPIIRDGLPPIWREIRFLEPAMGAPAPAEPLKLTADAEMSSWIRQYGGKLYLIVVNHKPGARKATISHPLLKAISSLDVASEGRSISVKGGAFTDSFAEGDVHVYTTDPAGRKLMTTAAVEADIAAREAACIKPGNLLHSSRKVRARASEGFYAPWFSQYYYYAINGITDDIGWQLSHTNKPAWLDLTLPQEAKIGRVVIYSPDLQDYDLQFTSADGAVRVAEIRGSAQDVAEYTFTPQIPTLKLRITARLARGKDSPQGATLSEIEAYETPGAGQPTPVKLLSAGVVAPSFTPPAQETGGQAYLWNEDFKPFRTAAKYNYDGKDDKWVLNESQFSIEQKPEGGVILGSLAPSRQTSMTHMFPYDSAYRYFQVKIANIEGEGYKFTTVAFTDSSGEPGYRTGINTNKPGIYTLDTYYVHDSYRTGAAKGCWIPVYICGTAKDGKPTVRVTFDWMRLARRPVDGVVVTLADGSPLPASLKAGDELLYRVVLDQPAADVTVEALADASYWPLLINGEPSVQLAKTGAKDGREWAAVVKLGAGTSKFDGTKGYPVVFRAVVTGGAIKETYSSVGLKFE